MKTIDYINTLIKEKEELKALCKSHVATIRLIKKELNKLNTTITKKDKKILKLESESLNVNTQKELDKVKSELNDLQSKYNEVVRENVDLRKIFDEIENICDSD